MSVCLSRHAHALLFTISLAHARTHSHTLIRISTHARTHARTHAHTHHTHTHTLRSPTRSLSVYNNRKVLKSILLRTGVISVGDEVLTCEGIAPANAAVCFCVYFENWNMWKNVACVFRQLKYDIKMYSTWRHWLAGWRDRLSLWTCAAV
jgi:hypothetical protein